MLYLHFNLGYDVGFYLLLIIVKLMLNNRIIYYNHRFGLYPNYYIIIV